MKLDLFNNETKKVWKSISGNAPHELLQLELHLYKKLLMYFQLGESCYFIFNFQYIKFDYVSEEITNLLGYPSEKITPHFLLENIHPDDRAWFLACQDHATHFSTGLPLEKKMIYKIQYDFRMKKQDGKYVRLMLQTVVVQIDDDGHIVRTLIVLTDISHLKMHKKPCLSYVGMNGEPSYIDVNINHPYLDGNEKKYASSSLSNEKIKEYSETLQKGFSEEKWYLDALLNMELLSHKSKIPGHYISQIINQQFGSNFFNYVNSYRVQAMKEKLTECSKNNITIEGLAYMSGFNSKAAFQRAFKKHTGMSPKEYRNQFLINDR